MIDISSEPIPEHEHLDDTQCYAILKKYAPSDEILDMVHAHGRRVADKALEVAEKVPGIDMRFIRSAALMHDIGRFRRPPGQPGSIRHGIEGAKVLRKEGLEMHARVAERHIGIGITAEDIREQGLDLPEQDFSPRTPEELLIAYADNLDNDGIQDERYVEDRYAREVGEYMRERVRAFHNRIHQLTGSTSDRY